jgi:peptidoglycan L-alanyl-D-glutamate endopeptidase CwlK
MPHFSSLSAKRLATCDPRLQELLFAAIKERDFTVLCGHRTEEEQEDAVRRKTSTKHWPDSLHNQMPSKAVDIAPYPVDWNDTARFARLVGYIERIAEGMNIPIRWGGDWDQDGRTADEKFIDMPHLELIGE